MEKFKGHPILFPEEYFECDFCHNWFKRKTYKYLLNRSVKHRFCNSNCRDSYQKTLQYQGINNPNFNRRWNKELKDSVSKIVKQRYLDNPELKVVCGNSNRGKKRTEEEIKRWHSNPAKVEHSLETRKKIGEKSKQKWTQEYKEKHRKIMESKGLWIPFFEKTDWQIYALLSDWIERMFDYCTEKELLLLSQIGLFNAVKNPKGLVRDHKYSRYKGFENKVFPVLVRHPANFRLVTSSENVAKRFKNNDCIITLEELFTLIKNFNKCWKEQDICLDAIKQYEEGQRWIRQ